jgi:hypothetical protein
LTFWAYCTYGYSAAFAQRSALMKMLTTFWTSALFLAVNESFAIRPDWMYGPISLPTFTSSCTLPVASA